MRLALILLLLSAGCAREKTSQETAWSPASVDDLGPVVAQVGTVSVRAREVEAEMVRSASTARKALDDLVSLHLMAELARRQQGYSPQWLSDPELKSALAERLIDREIAPRLAPESVPDTELKALYQKNIKMFVHPRLVDIAVLAVYTGPLMKVEARLRREETARALTSTIAGKTISGPEDFQAIAKEPAWRDRKVMYRRVLQGDDEPFSTKVGLAVAKLKAPGDTTSLIEDETGFYLATYAGEKPPESIAFTQARPTLLEHYYEGWRKLRLQQLTKKLGEGHRIEAHPQLLQ